MSQSVLTPEQREWANRVLGILGKTPTGGGPLRTPDSTGPETKSEAPSLSGGSREERGDHYGEGYKRTGFELKAEVYGELKKALNDPKAKKMISAQAWLELANGEEVQKEREEALKKFEVAEKYLKLKEPEFSWAHEHYLLIEKSGLLPLLDAPENNPERAEVGVLLNNLEEIESDIKDSVPTKEQAAKKFEALAALERKLFAWNDRRASQDLPPSTEAVAMLDLLQTVHRNMIAEAIEHGDEWDPPIAGYAGLPKEEQTKLKETWKSLCNDKPEEDTGNGNVRVYHGEHQYERRERIKGKDDLSELQLSKDGAKTQQEAEQFRLETLANFSRLLASPAGRRLIDRLNSSGKRVHIAMTTDKKGAGAEPLFKDLKEFGENPDAGLIKGKQPGEPWDTRVVMPSGVNGRDSSESVCTKSGNYLYAPQFIMLGHELIHALHNARGKNQRMSKTNDENWDDQEEFHTIFEGRTSEQLLRHQYGLVTERYGHKTIKLENTVGKSFAEAVLATKELREGNKREETEKILRERGFDPDKLSDVKKLQYAAENVKVDGKGLVELGWNPNQLSVSQAQDVLGNEIHYSDLKVLGWSPLHLPGDKDHNKISYVVKNKRCHPKSPAGLRFRKLGGEESLKWIGELNDATECGLKRGAKDDGLDQLQALDLADTFVQSYARINKEFKDKVCDKTKLKDRLEMAVEYFKDHEEEQEAVGRMAAVQQNSGGLTSCLSEAAIKAFKNKTERLDKESKSKCDVLVKLLDQLHHARTKLINGGGGSELQQFETTLEAVRKEAFRVADVDKVLTDDCTAIKQWVSTMQGWISDVEIESKKVVKVVENLANQGHILETDLIQVGVLEEILKSPYIGQKLRLKGEEAIKKVRQQGKKNQDDN